MSASMNNDVEMQYKPQEQMQAAPSDAQLEQGNQTEQKPKRTFLGMRGGGLLVDMCACFICCECMDGCCHAIDDCLCCCLPDFYAGAVEEASGDPSGWAIPEWSLDSSRHMMQKLGVQTSILSITAPGACILQGKASHELARKPNLENARIRDREPEKFDFFANLPDLLETQVTLDELQYALDVLKADRVTLFTRYGRGNLYLGHPNVQPIWEELNQRACVVFIHPTHPFDTNTVNSGTPQPIIDYPHETTRTAIKPRDDKGREQIVYYQAGIGSEHNIKDELWGGLTGYGLAQHVREAYSFICRNYEQGDDIILLGFSRGAFTARTIAAMIDQLGLLSSYGMAYFFPIFKDWENQVIEGYVPPFHEPFPTGTSKPSLGNVQGRKDYLDYLEHGQEPSLLKYRSVRIRCVGVFDTVGALGIPTLGVFRNHPSQEYTFVDTFVPNCVDNAFQALALDEHRRPFTPTIWETPPGRKGLNLRQCWFPGCHADIGGGNPDPMVADITMAWMVSRMGEGQDSILSFDLQYIRWLWQQNINEYVKHGKEIPGWSLSRIDDSLHGIYYTTGSLDRTPKNYHEHDIDGSETSTRCIGTEERVHPSVRIRMGLKGPSLDDEKRPYSPPALKNWSCVGVDGTEKPSIRWVALNKVLGDMPEDNLSDLEMELLNMTPLKVDDVWKIQASGSGNHKL
ncbi:2-amino-3-carboxymuconate-6-semialdehyde decarboxylase, partial [Aureobasidium melanogenum]